MTNRMRFFGSNLPDSVIPRCVATPIWFSTMSGRILTRSSGNMRFQPFLTSFDIALTINSFSSSADLWFSLSKVARKSNHCISLLIFSELKFTPSVSSFLKRFHLGWYLNKWSNSIVSLISEPNDAVLLLSLFHSFVRSYSCCYRTAKFECAASDVMSKHSSGSSSLNLVIQNWSLIDLDKSETLLEYGFGPLVLVVLH